MRKMFRRNIDNIKGKKKKKNNRKEKMLKLHVAYFLARQ